MHIFESAVTYSANKNKWIEHLMNERMNEHWKTLMWFQPLVAWLVFSFMFDYGIMLHCILS